MEPIKNHSTPHSHPYPGIISPVSGARKSQRPLPQVELSLHHKPELGHTLPPGVSDNGIESGTALLPGQVFQDIVFERYCCVEIRRYCVAVWSLCVTWLELNFAVLHVCRPIPG